jgi:hypothetical protein
MDRVSSHSAKEFSTMQPDLILTPFGENATPGTIDPIPETRGPGDDPQQATWDEGFPLVTMTPLAAGGIPPKGQDFNGVLNAISEHTVFTGRGGQYKWSSAYVTASGGYDIGDVIQADNGLDSYVSLVNDNTDNFNTTPASIGVSWALYAGRKTQTQATETVSGIAEIATQAEVTTGADDARIVTPAKLRGAQATQAEAEAVSDNAKIMTPLRTRQAVSILKGLSRITASGSFTVPAGITNIWVSGCGGGGGGGGGGSNNTGNAAGSGGSGGGAGQSIIRQPFSVTPGEVIAITVGGAGTAGTAGSQGVENATAGGPGGVTTIGALINLLGGGGGSGGKQGNSVAIPPGPAGGSGFPYGGDASDGSIVSTSVAAGWAGLSGAGASSEFGGGGGGSKSGSGFGSVGKAADGFGSGGSGGGGCYASGGPGGPGGVGAPGLVIIEW